MYEYRYDTALNMHASHEHENNDIMTDFMTNQRLKLIKSIRIT
jgi:hypothetical protein